MAKKYFRYFTKSALSVFIPLMKSLYSFGAIDFRPNSCKFFDLVICWTFFRENIPHKSGARVIFVDGVNTVSRIASGVRCNTWSEENHRSRATFLVLGIFELKFFFDPLEFSTVTWNWSVRVCPKNWAVTVFSYLRGWNKILPTDLRWCSSWATSLRVLPHFLQEYVRRCEPKILPYILFPEISIVPCLRPIRLAKAAPPAMTAPSGLVWLMYIF